MRSGFAFVIALLPAALATPQRHGYHGYGYRHHHKPQSSGDVSGQPFPTAIGTGPKGSNNGTVGLGSTGRITVATTPILIPTLNGNVESTQAALSRETPVESAPVPKLTISEESGKCSSGTTTLTYHPTVTVTVTASAVSSPPVESPEKTPTTDTSGHETVAPVLPTISKTVVTSSSKEAASKSPQAPKPIFADGGASNSQKPTETAGSEDTETKSSESPTAIVPTPQPSKVSTSEAPTSETANKATPTSSTAAPLTPVPAPAGKSGKKRGILASGSDTASLVAAFNNAPKVTWLVDWYSAPPPNLDSHIEFVPQNYGKQSDLAPKFEWTNNAKKAIANGAKYFLSFGEPETPNDKLHMEPQEAVDLFLKEMQPYAGSVTLGAPSVTQPDPDLAWLSEFLDLCDAAGCSIGFVCVHWIWSASEDHIQDFKNVVNKAIGIAKGKPVWVDNFAASGTNEEQQNFLNGVLPWLDSNDAVERYAYVPPGRSTGTGFLNADGSISSLGEFYANA